MSSPNASRGGDIVIVNIILLPGDSIEAWVNSIKRYDIDMELVSESYEIEEVIRLHRAKNNDSAAKQESIEGL